ncbi:MAG: thiamine biosynthesis protein ThiF [Campylobacterota bacterium]|nr:thiamine biosynthesis protein ThiF [Campylobacterota bacterium]
MMAGSRLSCIGIIGDGCGGGREFIIEDGVLYAHNPELEENIILLRDIEMPKAISKKGCILYVECENDSFEFDLSAMSKVPKIN